MREFQRYQLLVRRPNISRELVSERETLLSQLSVYIKQVKEEFQVTRAGKRKRKRRGEVVMVVVVVVVVV